MELTIFLVFLEIISLGHFVVCVLYSNDFAVELSSNQPVATQVAKEHGFYVDSKLEYLNVYHFIHPDVPIKSAFSAVDYVNKLQADPRIKHVFQQEHLIRWKRNGPVIHDKQQELPDFAIMNNSLYQRFVPRLHTKEVITDDFHLKFDDPYFVDQWYINNIGQTGGQAGLDLNVEPVWKKNFTGSGVIVCILDDGIDHTHPDLIDNFDVAASIDLNGDDNDLDPMPDTSNPNNGHGTRCAGAVVAKANNSVCGVGVAYKAKIGGVRMLDGTITDLLESKALLFKPNYINIYSASWGPIDDGATMEGPKPLAKAALQEGVKKGRNGLGVIYVWATGNGGLTSDDCNADGYVSSVETLAVGSVSNQGKMPYFMEQCTSTMAVVPTGGEKEKPTAKSENRKIQVVTTGLHGQCIENFEGTSGAAPLASGCIALVLQANSHLTWRDVQHLVAHSARIPSSGSNWFLNGAGLHVSHSFGFGLMDCGRMVEMAQDWNNVPPQRKCFYTSADMKMQVSYVKPVKIQIFCNSCSNIAFSHLTHLEHVQVYINLKHSSRGDIQIFLTSPAGTRSQLLSPRKFDQLKDIDFYFMTVHNWMENPYGNWTLEIYDTKNNKKDGILLKWSLILHGYKLKKQWKNIKSRKMNPSEIDTMMKREFSRNVNIKKYENSFLKERLTGSKNSDQNLKIESVKMFSSSSISKLISTLTKNVLTEKSRSVADKEDMSLLLTLSEKVIKKPEHHKSKLSEGFQSKPKSIAPGLLDEIIANDYTVDRKAGPEIGKSLQKIRSFQNWYQNPNILDNLLAAKLASLFVKASELQSEFLALKNMLNLTEVIENYSNSLGKEHLESNLSEKKLDSLSESTEQSSNNHSTKSNTFEKISLATKLSGVGHDIFAERMFFPSLDLRNKKSGTNKIFNHTLAPGLNTTRTKHNIFRNLLQNLRFYLRNYKPSPSVERRENLQNSLSTEPLSAGQTSEASNGISFKKLKKPVLRMSTEQSAELEEELKFAKKNDELMDKFKLYPRSTKNLVP